MKLSQNAIAGRGTSFRTYRCSCTRRFAGCTSPDPRSKLFKFLKLLSYRQSFSEWRYATSRQERSLSTEGAISNGKPFHPSCSEYGSNGRYLGSKGSG